MHVVSVGYAAVKGTRHLARDEVRLSRHGAVGDRRWCLVDVDAARVLRTVAHPALMTLEVAGRWGHGGLGAEPTGEQLVCDYWGREVTLDLVDHPLAAQASALVGRPVRLASAPAGAIVYAGAVSLVATATVKSLGESLGESLGAVDVRRFRATLVVGTDVPRVEEEWVGRDLQVGDAVVRPTARTVRCAVIEHDPVTGVRDMPLLRSLPVVAGQPVCGVDGEVVQPGLVRPGDRVRPV